jgi:DNA-directed RNA polymerase subunit M/transcription elongation factor TFIIS
MSEIKEERLDNILKQIKGFCPHCGKIILENDLSNTCSKCGQSYQPEDLIKSMDGASEVSAKFKQFTLQEELLIKCPNPECNYLVKLNWDACPECSTLIRKKLEK